MLQTTWGSSKLKQCLCPKQGLALGERVYCPAFIIRYSVKWKRTGFISATNHARHQNTLLQPEENQRFACDLWQRGTFFFLTETSCSFEIMESSIISEEFCISFSLKKRRKRRENRKMMERVLYCKKLFSKILKPSQLSFPACRPMQESWWKSSGRQRPPAKFLLIGNKNWPLKGKIKLEISDQLLQEHNYFWRK